MIVKEVSSSGEIVVEKQATRRYVETFEAERHAGYRIEISPAEGSAMADQRVHIDVLGPSDLKLID